MRTRKAALGIVAVGCAAALGGCGPEFPVTIVKLHAIEPDGAQSCRVREGSAPNPLIDAAIAGSQPAGAFFVGVELRNESDEPVELSGAAIEIDNAAPWSFLPGRLDHAAVLTLAAEGEEGSEQLLVVQLFDQQTAALMVESAATPIDNPGESFPIHLGLSFAAGTTEAGDTEPVSRQVDLQLTACNRCLDPDPETELVELCDGAVIGCSIAQSDGYSCP